MKKIIPILLTCLALQACAPNMNIGGEVYRPYGLFNQDNADPGVEYDISGGNLFWGVVLFETIVAPIYLIGFKLYKPVGRKHVRVPASGAAPVTTQKAGQ